MSLQGFPSVCLVGLLCGSLVFFVGYYTSTNTVEIFYTRVIKGYCWDEDQCLTPIFTPEKSSFSCLLSLLPKKKALPILDLSLLPQLICPTPGHLG